MAKRVHSADADLIYYKALTEEYKWDDLLPEQIYTYLQIYEKACNIPITLIMGTLLPTTAGICGTKI